MLVCLRQSDTGDVMGTVGVACSGLREVPNFTQNLSKVDVTYAPPNGNIYCVIL